MVINPLKIDDAIRVFSRGEELGMDEEKMKKALELYSELEQYADPEAVLDEIKRLSRVTKPENVTKFLSFSRKLAEAFYTPATYSLILAPRKGYGYLLTKDPEFSPFDGQIRPIFHSSGKFVMNYMVAFTLPYPAKEPVGEPFKPKMKSRSPLTPTPV